MNTGEVPVQRQRDDGQTLCLPYPRNLRPAETAFAVRDVHAGDGENVALDDGLFAVGTPGRLHSFEAGHVADINVMQALSAGEVARFHERLNGRCRQRHAQCL